MTENIISSIIYAITAALLLVLVLSYWLMWRIEGKTHILALLLFFFSTLMSVVVGNIHLWSNALFGQVYRVPYSWVRGIFMFATTIYLLKTTWSRNLHGGVGNIKEIAKRKFDKGTKREEIVDKST